MANLIDLTAQLVSAHASNTQMTSDQLYKEIETVYASLKALESGISVEAPEQPKQLTIKQAFKKDSVTCMVCGKSGFKTLTRHLSKEHQLKPSQYRKEFNIPSSQSLTAPSYSESRRKMAVELNLGAGLEKGRAIRRANAEKKEAPVPAVRVNAPVQAVTVKAPVPAQKDHVNVPAVTKKSSVLAKAAVLKDPAKMEPVIVAKASKTNAKK